MTVVYVSCSLGSGAHLDHAGRFVADVRGRTVKSRERWVPPLPRGHAGLRGSYPPRRLGGSGFRVQGSGFRVQGSGFRVQGSGFRVQGAGCPRFPGATPAFGDPAAWEKCEVYRGTLLIRNSHPHIITIRP